jgi:hypothetical protein
MSLTNMHGLVWVVFGLCNCFFGRNKIANPKPRVHNYYFDPQNGKDNADGLSPKTAFRSFKNLQHLSVKAGDSILLKSGGVFTDSLFFSGMGSAEKPVVIGKYGGRKRPYLKGDASAICMIHIYNSEHIVIRDLEISNKGKRIRPYLSGLLVEAYNYGTAHDITVENLFVHDVYGSLIKGEGNNNKDAGGGQAIWLKNLRGGEKDSIPSCFENLLVQNCYIKNCQRNGIMMWGNWVRKYWFASKNVVIRNNILDAVPGDGIVPVGCEAPLVEYNIMKNCPPTLPASEACDGIWPWSCNNAVIQFNIVSDHKSKVDGYGFDADYNCINSLFQYNLSFNNDGGIYLLCNSGGWPDGYLSGNTGSVFQYNISINDGIRKEIVSDKKGAFSPVIHITGPVKNSLIAHNLFIVKKKTGPAADRRIICSDDWGGFADSTFFTGNFISVEEPNLFIDPNKSTNNFYTDNKFIGSLSTPAIGFEKENGILRKEIWYQKSDRHWAKLIAFVKDKKVRINGKDLPILGLIGW